ncbi:MAG: mevalonate kinase family protein [Patescibacteria group bacterium]
MKGQKTVKVSAPGKVILSGEHAVVYGYPSLITAVSRRLSIKCIKGKKKVDSEIPIGCGMGSSAAYAVAVSALKLKLSGKPWDLEKINREAYKMEKKRHGNPSGADNTTVTYGGLLWYRKESEELKVFSQISPRRKLPRIILINSGAPKESTKEMVSLVGNLYRVRPKKVERIFGKIEEVTRTFLKFLLKEESPSLNDLIKENESLLEELGVVSEPTRSLIRKMEKIGAAVKISGAGGKTLGSGILLAYHPEPLKLLSFAKALNLEFFRVKLGEEGVRVD